MWELMVSASNAIESVVMIKWVWAAIGVAVWFLTVWTSVAQEPEYRQTEAAIIGSLIGAFLGFVFPVILVFVPFILPLLLAAAVVGGFGVAVVHFTGIGK